MILATVLKSNQDFTADIQFNMTAEIFTEVPVAGRVYWNMQKDDVVLVSYLNGDVNNPVIIDVLLNKHADNVQGSSLDDIHLRHTIRDEDGNVTGSITIKTDKDGNLDLVLDGNGGGINLSVKNAGIVIHGESKLLIKDKATFEVVGDSEINNRGNALINTLGDAEINTEGETKILGKEKITITAEKDLAIDVGEEGAVIQVAGDAEINTEGVATINAQGDINIDGATVNLGKNMTKQIVNNLPKCFFTGAPHNIANTNVKV